MNTKGLNPSTDPQNQLLSQQICTINHAQLLFKCTFFTYFYVCDSSVYFYLSFFVCCPSCPCFSCVSIFIFLFIVPGTVFNVVVPLHGMAQLSSLMENQKRTLNTNLKISSMCTHTWSIKLDSGSDSNQQQQTQSPSCISQYQLSRSAQASMYRFLYNTDFRIDKKSNFCKNPGPNPPNRP